LLDVTGHLLSDTCCPLRKTAIAGRVRYGEQISAVVIFGGGWGRVPVAAEPQGQGSPDPQCWRLVSRLYMYL